MWKYWVYPYLMLVASITNATRTPAIALSFKYADLVEIPSVSVFPVLGTTYILMIEVSMVLWVLFFGLVFFVLCYLFPFLFSSFFLVLFLSFL
jgi:hypothetical protein